MSYCRFWITFSVLYEINSEKTDTGASYLLFLCLRVLIFILNVLHTPVMSPFVVCDSPNQAHFIVSLVFKLVGGRRFSIVWQPKILSWKIE